MELYAKKALSKESQKMYIVTNTEDPTYRRVWKKASLVYYCKSIYGVTYLDFKKTHRGRYGNWTMKPYQRKK